MGTIVFASGTNGRYFYNAPKFWARGNLPAEIEEKFISGDVLDVQWASFGDDPDKYFFLYQSKERQMLSFFYGEKNNPILNKWLLETNSSGTRCRDKKTLKVVLGPGDSFFAWDMSSVRWANLPARLEEIIQGWLSPAGWIAGPPRLVGLGYDGTFFIVSDHGWSFWHISGQMTECVQYVNKSKKIEGFRFGQLEYVSFNPSRKDRWTFVLHNTYTKGVSDSPSEFKRILTSYATPQILQQYRDEELAEEKSAQEQNRKPSASISRSPRPMAENEEGGLQASIQSVFRQKAQEGDGKGR